MSQTQGRAALTQRQQEVLEHIRATTAWKGAPPTLREIASHFGCQLNAVNGHVKRLLELGYLKRDGNGKSRSLRVVGQQVDEVTALRQRVRELEEENARLRGGSGGDQAVQLRGVLQGDSGGEDGPGGAAAATGGAAHAATADPGPDQGAPLLRDVLPHPAAGPVAPQPEEEQ